MQRMTSMHHFRDAWASHTAKSLLQKQAADVNSHKVWCNATFGQETAPELTGMLPEAEVCFNLSPGGLFPLHSNNCYTWICSISDNQASANLEYCWTIQVFSSLLTGSCRLKAYYSYLRLKGSHSRKLVELTSLI